MDGEVDERLNDYGYIRPGKIPKNKFKLISLNVRSLRKHGPDVRNLLDLTNPNIVCIQETWHSNFNAPGYTTLKMERPSERGGGIACICRNDMDFQVTKMGITDDLEYILVKSKKIEVLNIYRPPNGCTRKGAILLDSLIDKLDKRKINFVCGDFNVNFMGNSPKIICFNDVMIRQRLLMCTRLPTRVARTSATLIDAIFTNYNSNISTGILETNFSDHMAPFVTFNSVCVDRQETRKTVTTTNNSPQAMANLSNMLSATNWENAMQNLNADESAIYFSKKFKEFKDICCEPITVIQTKNNTKEKAWMTKGLLVSRYEKNERFSVAIRTLKKEDFILYKQYNKIYIKLCRKARSLYYTAFYTEFAGNSRKLWKETNKILGRVTKEKKTTKQFKKRGSTITNKTDIANEFNLFFSTIGEKLSNAIPDTGEDYLRNLPNQPKEIFKFEQTDEETIGLIIDKMESKKSSSFDTISNFHLKSLKSSLLLPLKIAVNKSLLEGTFPNQYKLAKVVPLFKAGDREDFNNYRPISLLATISKIFEKVVHRQLYDFFSEHYMTDCQFGFRTKSETSHCITNFLNNIYKNKNKKFHLAILIDCKKAFDSVKISKLLRKLYMYGIRGTELAWFTSYLTNRKQAVEYDGVISEILYIVFGVPQGSILGPLLFLIFINDLPNMMRFMVNLYADDTSFQLSSNSIAELEQLANEYLKDAAKWFIQNNLTLHPMKTNFLVFGKAGKNEKHLNLLLDGHALEQIGTEHSKKSAKFLGVLLDDNLNWIEHINMVANKLRKTLYTLNSIRDILPIKTKIQIYNSLFKPHIDYCLVIWGNSLNIKPIELLQKRAIRTVFGKKRFAHAEPLLKRAKILNIKDSYTLACHAYMRKVAFREAPSSICSIFPFHYRRRRWVNVFDEHFPASDFWNRSPIFSLPKLWNRSGLPKELNVSMLTFKTRIKEVLLGRYYSECVVQDCAPCFMNTIFYKH